MASRMINTITPSEIIAIRSRRKRRQARAQTLRPTTAGGTSAVDWACVCEARLPVRTLIWPSSLRQLVAGIAEVPHLSRRAAQGGDEVRHFCHLDAGLSPGARVGWLGAR